VILATATLLSTKSLQELLMYVYVCVMYIHLYTCIFCMFSSCDGVYSRTSNLC